MSAALSAAKKRRAPIAVDLTLLVSLPEVNTLILQNIREFHQLSMFLL